MNYIDFMIAALCVIALPGQDVMYLISQSISNSRKAGLFTAFGLASGNIVHTTAIAFGFSYVVANSPVLLTAIKFVGAAYLIYLSIVFFRDKSLLTTQKIDKRAARQLYFRGVAMNVLNAKAWLFAVLFFPQFLNPQSVTPILDVYVLGIIFIIMTLIVFSTFAFLASSFAEKLVNSERAANIIRYFKSVTMLLIAIYLFL